MIGLCFVDWWVVSLLLCGLRVVMILVGLLYGLFVVQRCLWFCLVEFCWWVWVFWWAWLTMCLCRR